MKFRCETKDFLNAIMLAKQFIKKGSLSIVSCICLELYDNKLNIRFTDLKDSGEYFFDVENGEEGTILLRIEKIDSILRKINDLIIDCYTENNSFCINNMSKTISFKINILEKEINRFPAFPEIKEEFFIKLKKNELASLINKTIFMLSDDDTNYYNKGLFCELKENKIIMTSTDGRRLSNIYMEKEIKEEKQIIISFNILNILKNYLIGEDSISLFIDDKYICMRFDNMIFYSTLLSMEFLNYRKVMMEKTENQVIINRIRLKNAIECVSLMSDELHKLYLNLYENKIILKSDNSVLGEAENEIDCEYKGKDCIIVLNYNFLFFPLSVMDQENIILGFNNVEEPLLLKEKDNNNFINIIVPMVKDKNEK